MKSIYSIIVAAGVALAAAVGFKMQDKAATTTIPHHHPAVATVVHKPPYPAVPSGRPDYSKLQTAQTSEDGPACNKAKIKYEWLGQREVDKNAMDSVCPPSQKPVITPVDPPQGNENVRERLRRSWLQPS